MKEFKKIAWIVLGIIAIYNLGKILYGNYKINNDKAYVISGQFEDFKEVKVENRVVAGSSLGIGIVKKYENEKSSVAITTYKKVIDISEYCQKTNGEYLVESNGCLSKKNESETYYYFSDGKYMTGIVFKGENWDKNRIERLLKILKKVSE